MSFGKILFLEDDPGERRVIPALMELCRKAFHGKVEFETVATWKEAFLALEREHPDVFLVDLSIPPHGPEDSLKFINDHARGWPPVVVITGNEAHEEELRIASIKAGSSDFLMKRRANRIPEDVFERCYNAHLRRIFDAR